MGNNNSKAVEKGADKPTHQKSTADRPHGRKMPVAGEATTADGHFDLQKFLALGVEAKQSITDSEFAVHAISMKNSSNGMIRVDVSREHNPNVPGMPADLACSYFDFVAGLLTSGTYVGVSDEETDHSYTFVLKKAG